jgi:hypothetical protein
MVMLDHLPQGRIILGLGPGAMPNDANRMGIDPLERRHRLLESVAVPCTVGMTYRAKSSSERSVAA